MDRSLNAPILAILLTALAFAAGVPAEAQDKEKSEPYVGKQEKVPGTDTTVKTDRNTQGDYTVRPDSSSGPSVTFGGSQPTRDNPQGEQKVTGGWTHEFP